MLVLGGTSEIALAVVRRCARAGRLRRVVLAGRDEGRLCAVAGEVAAAGVPIVDQLAFEATDTTSHAALLQRARAGGDLDVVLLAFGELGDQSRIEADPAQAVRLAQTNYVGALSAGLHVAAALREQGHGVLIVLSSVAGQRGRRANFVYGSTKAGLDTFAQGLGDALHGSGAWVMVVRPGFVHTRMTAGLPPAPMSTSAEAVAEAIMNGLRLRRETVWVPARLRLVMALVRALPRPVFRRLRV
jgi:decaprenylphospho-beta-D-erythro-pentofuranosid-2-ulose 2-reductase